MIKFIKSWIEIWKYNFIRSKQFSLFISFTSVHREDSLSNVTLESSNFFSQSSKIEINLLIEKTFLFCLMWYFIHKVHSLDCHKINFGLRVVAILPRDKLIHLIKMLKYFSCSMKVFLRVAWNFTFFKSHICRIS